MVARQRALHRGRQRGWELVRLIGREIRLARQRLGLSIASVAREVGISPSELSRIERGVAEWASVVVLAQICAVVGLDLSVKAYPGGRPIRDAQQAALLARFRARLHPSLRWSTEVPLPNPGDQRAWDGMVRGEGWRYGTEAELNPIDGQALVRRLTLKQRDGGVDGVILLLPDTRHARQFRHLLASLLASDFPVGSGMALRRLGAGLEPGGNVIVMI